MESGTSGSGMPKITWPKTGRIKDPRSFLVLGSRARTGLPRLVLGSVAATVVHQSPIPALGVPIHETSRA